MPRVQIATQAWGVLQTNEGTVVPDVTVTLVDTNGDTALVYTTLAGSTSQPLVTDSSGRIPGYVEAGTYILTAGGTQYRVEATSGVYATALFDVKVAGALGDGTTDDTAIIQATIDDAGVDGGIVFFPPGTYKLTASLEVPSFVHLHGSGWGKSILFWPTDIGTTVQDLNANVAGVDASGAEIQDSAPVFRDLQLRGPTPSITPGVRNVQMDGIKLGSNAKMYDCFVQGFGSGIVLWKDHQILCGVKSGNNYYNLLFPSPRGSKGNVLCLGCTLEGASFACIAVGGDNTIDYCQFVGGNVGVAPYGIYKGDTYNAASTDGFINESQFIDFAFEGCCNGAILDESTGSGSGQDSILSSSFSNMGMVWDSTYKIASRNADYAVNVRQAANSTFLHGNLGFRAGDVATYRFAVGQAGCVVELSYAFKFDNLVHNTGEGMRVIDRTAGGYATGTVYTKSGTILQRELVEYDLGGASQVRRCTGATFTGVCYQTPTGTQVVVMEQGNLVYTLCEAITPGVYVAPLTATPYHAAPIGSSTAGFPIIGVAPQAGGGAGGSATPIVLSNRGRV